MSYRPGNHQLGCAGAGLAVLIAPILLLLLSTIYWPLTRFDSQAWQSVTLQAENYPRQRMVGDLLWRSSLDGLSRPQVLAMLGEPSDTRQFGEWDLIYWLGPETNPIGLDSDWLAVRFGPDGKVSEYGIVTD